MGLLDNPDGLMASPTFRIGLGLLSGGGQSSNFGQILQNAMQGSDDWKMRQAKMAQEAQHAEMQKMQMQQMQTQIAQQQAAAQEQARVNGILPQLIKQSSPGAPAMNMDSMLPPELRAGTPTIGAIAPSAGGFDMQEALRQRVPLKTIEELQKLTAGPEFSPEVRYDQSGRAFVTAKNGAVKFLDGIKARDKLEEVRLGDKVGFRSPYSTEVQGSLPIGQSADSKATNAVAWANNSLANQRFAYDKSQGDKPQYIESLGGFAIPRTQQVMPARDMQGNVIEGAGKMTEDQAKASGWLVQAQNAFKNMNSAMASTPSSAKPGFPDLVEGAGPFGITSGIANTMRGADRQKFIQGSSSLSEALLRAATGAGVNKDEAAQKIREITPVFGESPETTKQKMDSIPLYIESLKMRSGPGAKRVSSIMANTVDAAPPVPMKGMTRDGYKFKGGDPSQQSNWEKM